MKRRPPSRSAVPLRGRRVLVTRARAQAGKLSGALRALGAVVIEVPTIAIRPPRSPRALARARARLGQYDWLVLTSVNGVDAVFARKADRQLPPGLKICAIGPATRAALEQRGVRVDLVPQRYVAEAVVEALRAHVRGQRVLLARARVARDVIP